MRELLRFEIPIRPVPKKNGMRILKRKNGSYFVAPSKQYKEYEDMASATLLPFRDQKISEHLQVTARFYVDTSRRCDLTNYLECLDDVLVTYGVIEDDNHEIIYSHDGSRILVDRDNPRTEVEIFVLEAGEYEATEDIKAYNKRKKAERKAQQNANT